MKRLLYPVLLGLGLAACSQAPTEEQATPTPTESSASPTEATTSEKLASRQPVGPPITDAGAAELPTTAAAEPTLAAPDLARNIIYHGQMSLEVTDFERATAAVNALIRQHRAVLSTAHETRADGQHRQEMTIKVPPADYLTFLAALGQLGTVENKDVTSADVTADLLNTAIYLDAKQADAAGNEQQLAKASAQSEVQRLQVRNRQLRAEISGAQARLKSLGEESKWASLTLRYYQLLPAQVTEPPQDVAPEFAAAFQQGWSVLLRLTLVVVYVWPLALLAPVLWWWRRRWQLRNVRA